MPAILGVFLAASAGAAGQHSVFSFEDQAKEIERGTRGRLGVAVLDTGEGKRFGYRSGERFPMCSTFKLLAVAAVLNKAARGEEHLDRVIKFTSKDLAAYSPVTKDHADGEGMSLEDLCGAAMNQSDNTAANLILASLGGPSAVTEFARSIGDHRTRLDRNEPDLNQALQGDPRDTTTPIDMLQDLKKLILQQDRAQLKLWLLENKTGDTRIRASVPNGWLVGDKTGTGDNGTANDVAIIWPPNRAPILIAIYLTGSKTNRDQQNAAIAAAASAGLKALGFLNASG